MEVDQKSKSYQGRRMSPRARNTTTSKRKSSSNRNIFFGDQPQRAARFDSEQSNLYAHQNGRNFTVINEELNTFLGINFTMPINKLPTIAEYWTVDNLIGNGGIQNTMIRNSFCEISQNLHFAEIQKGR